MSEEVKPWRHNPGCFWCAHGVRVQVADGHSTIDIVLDERFQGGPTTVHGGVLTGLVDEALGQLAGVGAATATRDLGVTADVMGLLFGISSLMSLVLQLPMGVASDRYGRRWFMVVGIFITAIALGLRGSAHNVTVFAVSQALYGASGPLVFS